ncbi:MAG: hypothetical protein Q9178_002734 [Gyalolechia marmorata]
MQYIQHLADITASPFESTAHTSSSEVLSLHGETRKKRAEIALAVNGYGIEIRDLAEASSKDARRITYCSVEDPRPKILRFSDEKGVSPNVHSENTPFNLPDPGTPIVHIEALAIPQDDAQTSNLAVLCIHQDGQISCYDEALTQRKWGPQRTLAQDGDQVVQVSSVSIRRARKTFLKDRDDVLAKLDASTGAFASNLLLLLSRSMSDSECRGERQLMVHVLALRSLQVEPRQVNQSSEDPTQEILSLIIPEPIGHRNKRALFRIHASSGFLYQGTARHLSIYNLTTLTPQLVQTINFDGRHDVLSHIVISPDTIAMLSGSSVNVMDTQYASCRAKYEFIKLKQSSKSLPHDAKFVTYHSPSRSAIVLFGRKLMAVNLSGSTESKPFSRKRKRNGLLIDVIGRGSLSVNIKQPSAKRNAASSVTLGELVEPYQETTEWQQQERVLNGLLEKGNHLEFDQLVSSRLDALDQQPHNHPPAMHSPQCIVDYVLSSMFFTSPPNGIDHGDAEKWRELHVKSFFDQAWLCLVRRGLVSAEQVKASLRRRGLLRPNDDLKDGELIKALADRDKTLSLLLAFLQSSCLIRISEVCKALKIVIAQCATLTARNGQQLLSYGDEPVDSNGNAVDEMGLVSAHAITPSQQSFSESGHLHALFDAIIARCNACPAPIVTKAFKAHLSKPELRALIIMMRTKLRQDGWLSSYTDAEPMVDIQHHYNDMDISMIGKLLNCAVDSLGTGGWLLNNNVGDDGTVPVEAVSNMQAEISTALESIWEANYLRGSLEGLLLCGKGALHSKTVGIQSTLERRERSKPALPLGLKLEQNVSRMKVGAGGELQKRSRRDIGKLKSRRVPEYSFEQIAI